MRLYRGLKPFEAEEAKKRQSTHKEGDIYLSADIRTEVKRSSSLAAKGAGIGREKAAQIDYVETHAPELIPAIESGGIYSSCQFECHGLS